MIFFPFKTYSLITYLSKAEVAKRLLNNLKPKKLIRLNFYLNDPKDCFEGKIFNNEFKFKRIDFLQRRLPIITGNIQEAFTQTEILIKVQHRKSDLIFIYIWIGIISSVFLAFLMMGPEISELLFVAFVTLLVLIFPLLIYFLLRPDLNSEAKRALEYLENILEAEVIEISV